MTCTQMAQETAKDAVQIYGGRGKCFYSSRSQSVNSSCVVTDALVWNSYLIAITQTGMGRFVEHYHRTITFDSLLGGGVCT